jgi:hypothetical protein
MRVIGVTQYDLHVRDNERWLLNGVFREESKAVVEAKRLMATGRYQAVKVVRELTKRTGFVSTKVVFSDASAQPAAPKVALRSDVDGTVLCDVIDDLYRSESVAVISRVLAEYLEWQRITAVELLHDAVHVKRLTAYESFRDRAISIVAKAQARAADTDPLERQAVLDKLCTQAVQRIRSARAGGHVPDLSVQSYAAAYEELDGRTDAFTRDYLLHTGMTVLLTGTRSWGAKLDRLLPLIDDGMPVAVCGPVDALCADILRGQSVMLDLFGEQPSLGEALAKLATLYRGKEMACDDEDRVLPALLEHIPAGRLSKSAAVVKQRLIQGLRSLERLSFGSPSDDLKALARIVDILADDGATIAEPDLWDAVCERCKRMVEPELERISATASSPEARVGAMVALAPRLYGDDAVGVLFETLSTTIDVARTHNALTEPSAPIVTRLQRLCDWQKQVLAGKSASPYAQECAGKFDVEARILIEEHKVLERIEDEEADDPARLTRIVALVRAGAVPQGSSFALVQSQALALAQRSGFLDRFMAGAGEESEKNERLRSLWWLLHDAGLV